MRETRTRSRPMNKLSFSAQVFLERHFAPLLLFCRWLLVGYAYRRIPLTQGKFARVDPEEYADLARHKWCVAKQGRSFYAVRSAGGRQLRMHRVIMNAPAGQVVDHIDHDGLNNVTRNLRPCTKAQNAHNQRPQQGRSSKFKGVCWCKRERKWYSRIHHEGRQQSLGLFKSERAAARARDAAAIALHGEFAHLNFPPKRSLLAALKQRLCRRATGIERPAVSACRRAGGAPQCWRS